MMQRVSSFALFVSWFSSFLLFAVVSCDVFVVFVLYLGIIILFVGIVVPPFYGTVK
jgi:hypothetical protein